ncbi:Complement Clr-like EGF-like [Desmophyllum pertusum]|uniref:Complement Clr-like EGF-like n=1 Tax=Desmophyllum pertusum TaxID=174260 RepID=A0A9X0A5H1_9CNID|nr:Complement Clr-like EGF-like [Desmophyllum pertusum]
MNKVTCANNAKCANTRGSFRCECEKGFHGNPSKACEDVDECKLMDCGYGQNCTNTPGSFVCSCLKGFHPGHKPGLCTDIDECKTIKSPCGSYNYLSCENKPGTYSCRCNMGYTFNINRRKCEDIDECNEKFTCAENAECSNADGSYSCICPNGYSGDGDNFCDVNGSPSIEAAKAWNLLLVILTSVLLLIPWKM